MKSEEIRETFLSFFEERGHARVPSAPVVPGDDPTLYFTNAGMNQFKDVFLGLGSRPYTRAVDTQKCIRVSGKHNDLEEVGISPWHHTFFEMLGNWSFGDYFKEEAIRWGWELVTERFGLPRERLWATVFEGGEGVPPDEEAESLWRAETDLLPGRVLRLPARDNFWEMGATGPCGPCSEIHCYIGDDLSPPERRAAPAGRPRVRRDLEPRLHPVQPRRIGDPPSPARQARRHRHGLRAHVQPAPGRREQLRHRSLPAADRAHRRGDGRRPGIRGRTGAVPGDRRPRARPHLRHRRRRPALQRGPGLRAAPHPAQGRPLRPPARPARAVPAQGGGAPRRLDGPRLPRDEAEGGPRGHGDPGRGGVLRAHPRPRAGDLQTRQR